MECRRLLAPYVKAGFAVWIVGHRRHMTPGHTIADMADDYAQVFTEEFGGRVDLVVGESYGGMIAQYLAAFHPGSFGHIALVVTAAEASHWCKDLTSRMAAALARGGRGGARTAVAEALLPGERMRWVRRLAGPLTGRLMLPKDNPGDVVIEAQALNAFDSRAVLPRIPVPVLLLCSDRDVFFPKDVIAETAGLIPDCTLIWYEGQGHPKVAFASRRVAHDVLAFASRAESWARRQRSPRSTSSRDRVNRTTVHAGFLHSKRLPGPVFAPWGRSLLLVRGPRHGDADPPAPSLPTLPARGR